MTSRSPEFINNDRNLLSLDFLAISDTRLSNSVKDEYISRLFNNWIIQARFDCNSGKKKHMGMLLLRSKKSKKTDIVKGISEKCYLRHQKLQIQIIIVDFKEYNLKSAFIYARETQTRK